MRRLFGVTDVKFNVICTFKRQEIFLRRRGSFLFWSSNCRWHNDLLTLSRRVRLLNIRSTTKPRKVGTVAEALELLVRSDLLRTREQLLEIRTVTDRIPHGVNLQKSDGSYMTRRDGEQMSKSLNGFIRCTRMRLDLCDPVLQNWTRKSIFVDGE